MAEDRHVTKRGVRAMLHPKPSSERKRDPFAYFDYARVERRLQRASLEGDAETHQLIQAFAAEDTRHPDFIMHGDWYYHGEPMPKPYLTLADIRRIVERRRAKVFSFAEAYGASPGKLRSILGVRTGRYSSSRPAAAEVD